jgi:hypothetical protein
MIDLVTVRAPKIGPEAASHGPGPSSSHVKDGTTTMPKIRHNTSSYAAYRLRFGANGRVRQIDNREAGRPCVANDHCAGEIVPGAPVNLCGMHIREIYGFAADLVSERWDDAIRSYVADLHDTFRPPRAVKQPRAGWVYFVRFGERIKVGYTTDPDTRLRAIPHDEVIGILPGTRDDEAAWHNLLADFHVTGEWFKADAELLATLAGVVERSVS